MEIQQLSLEEATVLVVRAALRAAPTTIIWF
jgi:hypothetical protein